MKASQSPRSLAGFLASLQAAHRLLPVPHAALLLASSSLACSGLSSCAVPSPQLFFTASRVPVTDDHDFPKTVTIAVARTNKRCAKTVARFKRSHDLHRANSSLCSCACVTRRLLDKPAVEPEQPIRARRNQRKAPPTQPGLRPTGGFTRGPASTAIS